MDKKIKVFAPATVANLGPGYDILGLALNDVGDFIEMKLTNTDRIEISMQDFPEISTVPEKNVAGVALQAMLRKLNSAQGFNIQIKKNVLPGSGLGSSASSAAGAVFGANELLDKPFSKNELVEFAMQGEAAVSGIAHADNVAPSLLGGVTLIRSYFPLDVVKLKYPPELRVVVVHPQIEVKTADSKRMLRKDISMKKAVQQWGNVAGLIAGLASSDFDLIGRSLEDVVVEPTRSMLIPGFDELKRKAIKSGALGCSISGSGPSVFALTDNDITANIIAQEFRAFYKGLGIDHTVYQSLINTVGATIID